MADNIFNNPKKLQQTRQEVADTFKQQPGSLSEKIKDMFAPSDDGIKRRLAESMAKKSAIAGE